MNIHRFKDFVSISDQKIVLDFCKNNPNWKPLSSQKKFSTQQKNTISFGQDNDHLIGIKEMFDVLVKYNNKIAELLYEKKIIQENISGMSPSLFKYPKGYNLPAHIDTKNAEWITQASVLYFNKDYTGGELFFPLLNIKINPSPRELIVFSQETNEYLHEVKQIKDGIRYSSATWWGPTKLTSEESDLMRFTFEK